MRAAEKLIGRGNVEKGLLKKAHKVDRVKL
jgi:hypothetical protein